MDTFKQARKAALEVERKTWGKGDGTLYAEKAGLEDERGWVVFVGAREWLRDGDDRFARLDDRVVEVDKTTGKVSALSAIFDADRIAAMTETR